MSSDIAVNKLSGKLQNLERTIDEQKEKITEYERQILENKGRIFYF
jgi:cell division protein FtsL